MSQTNRTKYLNSNINNNKTGHGPNIDYIFLNTLLDRLKHRRSYGVHDMRITCRERQKAKTKKDCHRPASRNTQFNAKM